MILKKIIISVFATCFLTGCLQSTSFLGPAITVASTGNVYQAGLSYGSSQAIKKVTGKTPAEFIKNVKEKSSAENIKNLTDNKKLKIKEKQKYKEFFALVKSKIEKKSEIINLANQ